MPWIDIKNKVVIYGLVNTKTPLMMVAMISSCKPDVPGVDSRTPASKIKLQVKQSTHDLQPLLEINPLYHLCVPYFFPLLLPSLAILPVNLVGPLI